MDAIFLTLTLAGLAAAAAMIVLLITLMLLVFYLHLDREKTPLIIDQPEDNLDNDSIFTVLARCIREAK